MLLLLTATLLAILCVVVGCIKFIQPHKYWKEKGIRYVRPWYYVVYMVSSIFRFKAFPYILQKLYNVFPEQRYFGCYQFLQPALLVRDPELLKTILVKEFETFPEHRPMMDPVANPIWSKNLFAMKGGADWHNLRATISPAFDSSKMKGMFVLMKQCAKQFADYHLKQGAIVDVDLKDATARFSNDIIGTTVFGITCNSLVNPNNEFYLMAKKTTACSISRALAFLGCAVWPDLAKFFKCRYYGEKTVNFYGNLIKKSIKIREEKGIVRHDMIHLLMEARKGRLNCEDTVGPDSGFAAVPETQIEGTQGKEKAQITEKDIIAQTVLFYFGAFETASKSLNYLVNELALNFEIQERLREEVDNVQETSKGDVTYEALLQMKYLDMVVSETLRKWPPTIVTDRRSVKPFTINPERVWEQPAHLDAGTLIMVPIFAIHRDAKNYPEPDKFDPERFNPENRSKIKPFTYLPFGAGPRSCIGSRFALLEMKTFIFYILSDFEIVPIPRMDKSTTLSKAAFESTPDGGFWVGLKRRHEKTA